MVINRIHWIAHRGISAEAPENTLSAFQYALNEEMDFIELDIRLSKDGIPIAIHDETFLRTTNTQNSKLINEWLLNDILALDAGSWFSPKFKGETIPTLVNVLDLLDGKKTGLMIELKPLPNEEASLAKAVAQVLKEHITPSHPTIYIGSISAKALKEFRKFDTRTPLISIIREESDFLAHLSIPQTIYAINHLLVSSKHFKPLHEQGKVLWAWTISEDDDLHQLFSQGITGIISNSPHLLKRCVRPF